MSSTFTTPYDIAKYWAPIYLQDCDTIYDYFRRVTYDGDWNGHNNWDNADESHDLSAFVYYSFLETDTHYFIGYYDYHARDYYVPVFSDAGQHENDMEGVLLVVEKTGGYGQLVFMETQAHYDYYQYKNAGVDYIRDDGEKIEGPIIWNPDSQTILPTPFSPPGVRARPLVFLEPGGHGIFGNPADRPTYPWHPGFVLLHDHIIMYTPGGVNETPSPLWITGISPCNYALIAIDNPDQGLWQWRGQYPLFYNLYNFRGNDGYPDNSACAPWGFDDWSDGDSFRGEWFYDPANMLRVHIDYDRDFDRTYIWNPFAIELSVVWYKNLWNRDSDSPSDPYLRLRMADGEGQRHWVLGAQEGTQKSWIWWNAPKGSECRPGITVYGFNDGTRIGFESRDFDPDGTDEWLMGTWSSAGGFEDEAYTHWYYLNEGDTQFDWGGSIARIYVRGDVQDEDIVAPQFVSTRCWPSTHLYATDARSILFQSTIFENMGLSEVQIRFKTNDTHSTWSEWKDAAQCGDPRNTVGGYEFDYTYSMTRDIWHDYGYMDHTIFYQWRATDNDDDRPGDALTTNSPPYCGPRIGGELPEGVVSSVSGDIIAFTTDEWQLTHEYPLVDFPGEHGHVYYDLNHDDCLEQLIQYYDVSNELVVFTGEGGVYPSVSGEKIAAILNPRQELVPMVDMERVEYCGGYLGVYDIPSDTWTTPLSDDTMMYESVALSGTSVVYGLAESGSEQVAAMDLNGDGDRTDHLIYMFDLSNPSGTHKFVGEGTSPDIYAAVYTIAYMTDENEVGSDLNGNGRLDSAIQFYDYQSGERGVVAGPSEGYFLSPPSVGIGTFEGLLRPFIAYCYESYFSWPVIGLTCTIEVTFPAGPRTADGLCTPEYSYTMSQLWMWGQLYGCGRLDAGSNMVVGNLGSNVWKLYLATGYEPTRLISTGDIGTDPQMSGYYRSYGPVWNPLDGEHSLVAQTQPESGLSEDLNSDGDTNDYVISLNNSRTLFTVARKAVSTSEPLVVFSIDYLPISQIPTTRTCSVDVTFPGVGLSEGIVRAETRPQKFPAPILQEGYTAIGPPLEISTTAGFNGKVEVKTSYDPAEVLDANNLRLMQFNPLTSKWDDITTGVDKAGNTVIGNTDVLGRTLIVTERREVSSPVDIGGYVFLDSYQPGLFGVWDYDEFGLGNWRLTLQGRSANGDLVDLEEYTDGYTDIGRYSFGEIPVGNYWVNLSALSGYYYTTRLSRNVVVEPGAPVGTEMRIDFGVLIPSPDPQMPFALRRGWNLWSCPMTVENLSAKSLLATIGTSGLIVSKLDKTLDKYVSYVVGDPDKFDFPIVAGEGYYVWSSDPNHFTLKGELLPSSSIQLKTGWNMIGYSSMQPMMASELLENIEGGHGLIVASKNPDTGKYHSYVVGDSAKLDFTISPGNAYYIWADGPSVLAFS